MTGRRFQPELRGCIGQWSGDTDYLQCKLHILVRDVDMRTNRLGGYLAMATILATASTAGAQSVGNPEPEKVAQATPPADPAADPPAPAAGESPTAPGARETTPSSDEAVRKQLIKATACLAINAGNGAGSGPSIRLFYTHAFWNDAAQVAIAAGGSGKRLAQVYGDATNGGSFGVQAEMWW